LESIISIANQLKAGESSSDEQGHTEQAKADSSVPEPLQGIKKILERPCEEGLDKADAKIVLENLAALKEHTTNPQALEVIKNALDEYHRTSGNSDTGNSLQVELLQEKIEALTSFNDWKASSESVPSEPVEAKAAPAAQKAQPAEEARKTMRVTEDSIDKFLNYVGELIAVGEMYSHLQKIISESDLDTTIGTDFRRVNDIFSDLSDNLQKSIMEVRRVTVRTILQKIPRMVRDTATPCGKQVKVELIGEDIEVDKRLIETLDAPLTHMVRNAVDHGIEAPDVRQASGKPPAGTIKVAVIETADDVSLSIKDDGKGLNIEAIKAKAVSLGLLDDGQELSQEQIIDMIFTSGVSTAEKVTDVSGRGVGMDVVKRNITEANGKITIDTETGKGTEFKITLPKTVSTQIITGFLVKLDNNRYVIPMDKVLEVFRPELKHVSSVTGRGECVLRHDKLLPVVKLADIFNNYATSTSLVDSQMQSCSENGEIEGIMVAATAGKKSMALYVDDVIAVQKVVLKELDAPELDSQIYSAAAVMGDGTVAMVLDIDHLFNDIDAERMGA
ncbi:MAG: ATP-binding protein, partial [Phycisphaerales bacterium]